MLVHIFESLSASESASIRNEIDMDQAVQQFPTKREASEQNEAKFHGVSFENSVDSYLKGGQKLNSEYKSQIAQWRLHLQSLQNALC